jgi:23S rRNA (uracil1939-C5)-methyltransferase
VHCKHFGVCGGCTLPGVPYPEQLAKKRRELSRLLGIDVPPLIPSPAESGFRSKVAFVFAPGPRGRGLIMGHYGLALRQAQGDSERSRGVGSQRVIPIEECPVHHERGNRIAFALRDHLARVSVIAPLLRHVIVRVGEDGREASAMLVVYRNDKALRTPVKKFLASPEKPDGFFVNIHAKPGPFMVGDETIKIEGRSHVKEVVNGVSYLVSPTAFFQTNVGVAAAIVKIVLEEIGPIDSSARVLDLYCGTGLFALQLAKIGAKVTAIEENRSAIKDAEANVRLNRIAPEHVRFIAGRVEDFVKGSFGAVVMDPPRQGCPPAVLSAVFEQVRPARVVYVSCNPDALAKELPVILKAGYRVTRAQAVDMFPHTNHIETVMAFSR